MIRGLIAFIAIGFLSPAYAGLAAFCGDIDRLDNAALLNIIELNDLSNGGPVERSQCGLPGESLPICSSCSLSTSEEMMQVIRPVVGEAKHLAWHFDWHAQRSDKAFLHSRGELTGEDFFYMHRLMIKMVQLELAGRGQPCMAPWTAVPDSALDTMWPLPQKLKTQSEIDKMNARLAQIKKLHVKWTNPKLLKKVSLGQLGRIVEPSFHQELHAFYRSNPLCSREAKAQGFECDDLLPTQTSPLNKYFWKIHGLVDELIGHWLNANGYQEISLSCGARPGCYQWKGTWIGNYPRGP